MFGTLLRFQLQKTKKPLTPPTPRSMLNYWITTHSLGCQWVTSTLYGGERGEFVTKDCCEGLKVAYSRKLAKKWSNFPECPKTFCPWLSEKGEKQKHTLRDLKEALDSSFYWYFDLHFMKTTNVFKEMYFLVSFYPKSCEMITFIKWRCHETFHFIAFAAFEEADLGSRSRSTTASRGWYCSPACTEKFLQKRCGV